MKLQIDIKAENIAKNDILIFNGKEFEPIDKNAILSELWAEIGRLKNTIKDISNENERLISELKHSVNNRLEEQYKILQVLVKEQ